MDVRVPPASNAETIPAYTDTSTGISQIRHYLTGQWHSPDDVELPGKVHITDGDATRRVHDATEVLSC